VLTFRLACGKTRTSWVTTIVSNAAMAVLVMEGTTVRELLVWLFVMVNYVLDTE
jgi:hypothetical protein